MADKLPAFQFYTSDWLTDPELRACSLAARGLWIDCLCVMSESQERGVLRLKNGAAVTVPQLARMVGATESQTRRSLSELEACGVLARTADGAIYSKRMVEDEQRRQTLKTNGQAGGRPKGQPDSNQDQNQNGGQTGNQTEAKPRTKTGTRPKPNPEPEANQTPNQDGNQNGGSSSSSSSSASASLCGEPPPGEKPEPKSDKPATKKPAGVRPRNPLFDAIAETTGLDPATAGPLLGSVTATLAAAEPPYTPEDVRAFLGRFHELCPHAAKDKPPRLRPTPKEVERYIGLIRSQPPPVANSRPANVPFD
jgi:hypothetical protein